MNRKQLTLSLLALVLTLSLAACGAPATPQPTPTVQAPPAATDTQVVLPTAAPITVIVPVTVIVPQTVVVTATPEPATPAPEATEVMTPEATQATTPEATEAPTLDATQAAAATQATAGATAAPAGSETFFAALPPINTTPMALNGPDPMAGVTSKLFSEYFAPPDFWGTGSDVTSTVSISGGHLTIVSHKLQSLVWTLNGTKGTDFYAQVYMAPTLCGYGDNYGLVFRAKDNANLELFGISCDGRYRLLEFSQGQSNPIVDWTVSRYIRKYETTNVIGVHAAGDQVSLYVNDYFLATVTAGANLAGRFGLYVGNIKTPNLTVNFNAVTAERIGP